MKKYSISSLLFCLLALSANMLSALQMQQRDVTYFVDVVVPEADLDHSGLTETDVNVNMVDFNVSPLLSRWEQYDEERRLLSHTVLRRKIYLMSNGSWQAEIFGPDRRDYPYPVEYVLPYGYRGFFETAFGVPGAPPLQVVNGKIEIYIPSTGIFVTSSAAPSKNNMAAPFGFPFYYERYGQRVAIPLNSAPPGEAAIIQNRVGTSCHDDYADCVSYFVGAPEDVKEDFVRRPGSIQRISENIAPPHGTPIPLRAEYRGRTLNGRPVVLAIDDAGRKSWQYVGPEPVLPGESQLIKELKVFVRALVANNAGITTKTIKQPGSDPEQLKALLKFAGVGPYYLIRKPYTAEIEAHFYLDKKTRAELLSNLYYGLIFLRVEQGWKIVGGHFDRGAGAPSGPIPKSELAAFVGMANTDRLLRALLRQDGVWDYGEGSSQEEVPFAARDINGNAVQLEIDSEGMRRWQRTSSELTGVPAELVLKDLNQTLDRYIGLFSDSKIDDFLVETGHFSSAGPDIEFKAFEELLNDNPAFRKELDAMFKESGEVDFSKFLRNKLMARAVYDADIPASIEIYKSFRKQVPDISRIPFSADFFADYSLQPGTEKPQVARGLTGHGRTWRVSF